MTNYSDGKRINGYHRTWTGARTGLVQFSGGDVKQLCTSTLTHGLNHHRTTHTHTHTHTHTRTHMKNSEN